MPITLSALCLVTLILCNVHGSLEHEIPRRSFLSRRAIDGTRGRKYFDPEEEGAFDSYGSAGGQYDPYQEKTDLSDIRRNVPGEPGTDYPAYTTLPQTGFTCEGRSRGYYADEVSGCQVFHVCHDVLVSSFLCPIGSIFSQKLLTCDWWSKVDCPSSSKYMDVNRNSYQQDDDEMIRNAYAMISLQSGTDVTKDGLVDPDRTGSVIDYQRNPGRIVDYSLVDTTGNDLRANFEDYPRPVSRNFLPPYRSKDKKPETDRNYQGRYYNEGKSRSPYEDSPIIRVQKIGDPNYRDRQSHRDFQDDYRRPNEFTDQFQPSYAPTVPTVTTTTRRFYSPTVPTPSRSSTLAYNKLDQVIDSSDYYFSQRRTKSFVTPPTRVFSSEDRGGQDFGGVSLKKLNRDEDYGVQESYEDDYEEDNSEERKNGKSREPFRVRVAEDFNLNRTGVSNGRSAFFDGVYGGFEHNRDEEEGVDDFETRGSIGLGQALHKSFRGISVQEQNPVKDKAKGGGEQEINYRYILDKAGSKNYSEETRKETIEKFEEGSKGKSISDVSVSTTTPTIIESTIKASTSPQELLNSTIVKDSVERIDSGSHTFRPTEFLEPPQKPQSKFQIKVPDLSEVSALSIEYSTLDDGSYPGTRTTELPRFQSTYSDDYIDQPTSFEGNSGVTSNYGNQENSEDSNFQNFPTTVARPLVSSSGSRFASSNSDEVNVEAPQGDYSDNSRDFKPQSFQTTVSSGSLHSSAIGTSEQNSKHGPKKISSTPVIKSSNIEPSGSTLNPATHRSLEESKRRSQNKPGDTVEASTANGLFRSIKPETLKEIEERIEKNNSPYQVTFTVSKDEELVSTGGDLISKLIAEGGKKAAAVSDTVRELDIIESVEPEIDSSTELEATTAKALDVGDDDKPEDSFSSVVKDLKEKKNLTMISLLHLMSELLKLDKVPRPFSLSDFQDSELRTRSETVHDTFSTTRAIAEDVNSYVELQRGVTSRSEEGSTEPESETSVPRLKERILGRLNENFGEPIYRKDRQPVFDLPDEERSVDFQSGRLLKKTSSGGELNVEMSSIDRASSKGTVATSTQKTMLTTESVKTVVKTELLPSIGFSFDTDEGREEYVEAVLGGLIEPQAAESEKKETVLKGKVEAESMSKKNETSG